MASMATTARRGGAPHDGSDLVEGHGEHVVPHDGESLGGSQDFEQHDAECAALALTEAVTRLNDRSDPVPDAVWDEAGRHYDEPALAALVIQIALINAFNRLNGATR